MLHSNGGNGSRTHGTAWEARRILNFMVFAKPRFHLEMGCHGETLSDHNTYVFRYRFLEDKFRQRLLGSAVLGKDIRMSVWSRFSFYGVFLASSTILSRVILSAMSVQKIL